MFKRNFISISVSVAIEMMNDIRRDNVGGGSGNSKLDGISQDWDL